MKQGVRKVVVDEDNAGQRVDNYLMAQIRDVPRSIIYRIIRKGEVRVNKGRVKPDTRLNTG
ncbi:MAG: S4 domain-containing protein, partial [Thiohalophilus sp.]|nr:S4 domain-containing protein [Thiohalophilus sp.]